MKLGFKTSASVEFQIAVLDRRGRVVRRLPKRRNLILNSGLDAIGNHTADWRTAINAVEVGTGALVTKRASGSIEISANAGALTADAGFFVAQDVGRILKLNSGEEYLISGYTSPTSATSTNLTNAAASPGAIHYVNLTGLVNPTERSTTVAPGGTRVSTWDGGLKTMTHTIVLLTPILAAPRVYTEIGWSWTGTSGQPLFGCAPITPSINLGVGQRLSVTISLVVKPAPVEVTAVNVGLAVGNCLIERVGADVGRPSWNGVYLSASSPALAGPSDSGEPSLSGMMTGSTSAAGYTNGTFKRQLDFVFADSLGAISARSLRCSFGQNQNGIAYSWRLLLDAPLVKTANERINGSIEFSWGRELVN